MADDAIHYIKQLKEIAPGKPSVLTKASWGAPTGALTSGIDLK
jgi:hypothetical protein